MTDKTPPSPVDMQDPLPEASWLWRRVFVFVVTTVLLVFVWFVVEHLAVTALLWPRGGIEALKDVARYLLLFAWMLATYYLLAPSAEQLTKLVQSANLLRSGVQIAGRQIIAPDGSSDTATTVGQPPAPPIPGQGAPKQAPPRGEQRGADEGPPWDRK